MKMCLITIRQYFLQVIIFLSYILYAQSSNAVEVEAVQTTQRVILTLHSGGGLGEIGELSRDRGDQTPGESLYPLALDQMQNIYIGDSVNKKILQYSKDGKLLREINFPKEVIDYLEYIVIDKDGNIYVLISRGHPKIMRFTKEGKLDHIFDLSDAGRLEKSRNGEIKLNKRGIFAGTRNKLYVNADRELYVLGSDLLKLNQKGEIVKRIGPFVNNFFLDVTGKLYVRYIYQKGDMVEQYDKNFNLVGTGRGIYENIIWPEFKDSSGGVYGFTTDKNHKDVVLAKYTAKDKRLLKFPITLDELAFEQWTIDSEGSIYYTNAGGMFEVIKMSILPKVK